MTKRDVLVREIQNAPESLINEIIDFVQFLKRKVTAGQSDEASLSESSLSKDWLKPEEDQVWKNL